MYAKCDAHTAGRLLLAVGLVCGMRIVDVSGQTAADDKTQRLYTTKCALCHGLNGTPKAIAKGAPVFTDPSWTPSKETIVTAVMNGKGDKMKSFKGKLTPAEMDDVAEYVLKMKTNAALTAGLPAPAAETQKPH